MERRDFLFGIGAMALMSSCQTFIPERRYGEKGHLFLALMKGPDVSVLRVLNLTDLSYEDVEVPLSAPHSVVRHPLRPDELYVFESLGSALKVNMRSREHHLITHRESKSMFVGHGLYTGTDLGILSLEQLPDSRTVMRARSEKDLSLLSHDFPELGVFHHIVRLPGTSIAVTNSNDASGKPVMTFFDFKSKKVVKQVEVARGIIHMLPVSSTEIIGVTANIGMDPGSFMVRNDLSTMDNIREMVSKTKYIGPSPVVYANLQGESETFWDESRKDNFGWGLGIEKVPVGERMFLTGHIHSGSVMLWKNNKIEGIVRVPTPEGIVATADGAEFLVLSQGIIKVYSVKDLSLIKEISYKDRISFIYRYG